MKKTVFNSYSVRLLAVAFMGALMLTSCSKQMMNSQLDDEISDITESFRLASSNYSIEVAEELTSDEDGFFKQGAMEYTKNGEVLARVEFDQGEFSGRARLIKGDMSADIPLSDDFDTDEDKDDEIRDKCFEFEYPLSLIMEDGSTVTLNSEDDWEAVKASCEGMDKRECFEFDFPINLTMKEESVTVNNHEEMKDVFEECHKDHCQGKDRDFKGKGHHRLKKIIVEPVVKTDDCDYPTSGIIKFMGKEGWVATIDFGDGTCDDIAEKTTKDGVTIFSLEELGRKN